MREVSSCHLPSVIGSSSASIALIDDMITNGHFAFAVLHAWTDIA